MTTQLTAVFDDRDGADIALMRLRRNGIDYSIAELRAPDRRAKSDMPLLGMGPSYGLAMTEGIEPGEMYSAVLSEKDLKSFRNLIKASLGGPAGSIFLKKEYSGKMVSRIGSVLSKLKAVRAMMEDAGRTDMLLEVDGGITVDNVTSVCEAGANVLVAGSAVFKGDKSENVREFLKLING